MPGKIHVPVSFGVDGIDGVTRKLKGLGRTMGAIGATAISVGGAIGGKFALNAIEGARDLERNLEGLETVFKSSTDQMVEFSESAYKMGLSLSEAAKASTFIGSVLKQSGFSIEQTADLTEDLVELGADLALTYGYDVQEALLGMTALFRGEYDPIEKFGVAMKQSEIDAEKLARGLGGLTGAAERFADQQIRVEFLMERSADALGAVDRQQNNLAVQQNALNASFNNMRDTVATGLLPTLANLTSELSDSLMRVTPELKEGFDALIIPVQRFGEIAVDLVEPAIRAIADGMKIVGDILTEVSDPTTVFGEKLLMLYINGKMLFDQLVELVKPIWDAVGGFEGIAGALGFVIDSVNNVIIAFQNMIIWLEEWLPNAYMFFALNAELAMAKVIDAIDFLNRASIDDALAEAQTSLDNFTGSVNDNVAARIKANDEIRESTKLLAQEQFALAETERFFSTLTRLSPVEALQKQLAELIEFRAPQEAIDAVRNELKKLLGTQDGDTGGDTGGGGTVKDFVGEFYDKLQDEIKKQSASLKLQGLGLTDALIKQVLNSQGWEAVYESIVQGGVDAAKALQEAFGKTAAGAAELDKAVEAGREAYEKARDIAIETQRILDELDETIDDIQETFAGYRKEVTALSDSIDVLKTFEREIGRFEAATRSDLSRIENSLQNAFDNEQIFEDAYNNLLAYARAEMEALTKIQRRRDEVLSQRDMIRSVAASVASVGELTGLISDVTEKTKEVQINEVIEGIVESADKLGGFKTTLERNYIDVVTETVNKSKELTDNFKNVIERTRLFIDNLQALRELGLDPFLFNQLVEAGVEAGGATAQALVDGGTDTVNEVNKLQGELESMGVELGEMTYDVMKDQGEQFVSGIIAGLDAQIADLELQAYTMAEIFASAFETAFNKAIADMELKQIETATVAAGEEIAALTPTINTAEIDRLQTLVAGAQRYAENIGDPTKAAGAAFKEGIYAAAIADLQAGLAVDTSGLTSGMSSADLLAAASGGSVTVNNIYTTNPLDAVMASQSTVNSSTVFQTDNGTTSVRLGV